MREELLPEKRFALAQLGASAPCALASVYCCYRRLTSSMHANAPMFCLIVASSLVEDVHQGMHFVRGSILAHSAHHLCGSPTVLEHFPTDG